MVDPYYQDEHVTLYNGRCEDVLPQLANVGLVLTSPPYNLSEGGRRVRGSEWKELDGGYATYDDDMPHDEYVAWQRTVLGLCWDTLTEDGAIYYNHKPVLRDGIARLPTELNPDLPLRQIVTWDRGSGFTRSPTYYVPRYEWVLIMAKPAFRITTLNVDDVWRIPFETGSPHPAPFPLKLASTAINSTSAEVVLDPFAGSGTTLRAAKDAGRRAIGIELDRAYCDLAVQRLAQGVLF